jgi:hypothetical protein
MIAQRFRSVGWVVGVAGAATMLYLISLQVASERGRLEEVDRKIASTKRDIRQLQTEMGTRASLRQLERWNGDQLLSLSAPQAKQYLRSEASLASIRSSDLGGKTAAPPPAMLAVLATPEKQAEAESAPKPTIIRQIAAVAVAPKPVALTKQDRAVQAAIAPDAHPLARLTKPERVAMLDRDALHSAVAKEVARGASSDTKARSKPKL